MKIDISKSCADFLRVECANTGLALKSSHAHELVAAFWGYGSRAALLAEQNFPLSQLPLASILVPDVPQIERRRLSLAGLPDGLPPSKELARSLCQFLADEGHFLRELWLYESLELYVMEVLLPNEDSLIHDQLSGVMAETNATFDESYYESAEVIDSGDTLTLEVRGQYSGTSDTDRPFVGDKIDVTVMVELKRAAGRVAFYEPHVSAGGGVNQEYVDPDWKYSSGKYSDSSKEENDGHT